MPSSPKPVSYSQRNEANSNSRTLDMDKPEENVPIERETSREENENRLKSGNTPDKLPIRQQSVERRQGQVQDTQNSSPRSKLGMKLYSIFGNKKGVNSPMV